MWYWLRCSWESLKVLFCKIHDNSKNKRNVYFVIFESKFIVFHQNFPANFERRPYFSPSSPSPFFSNKVIFLMKILPKCSENRQNIQQRWWMTFSWKMKGKERGTTCALDAFSYLSWSSRSIYDLWRSTQF